MKKARGIFRRVACIFGLHEFETHLVIPSKILFGQFVTKVCKHCGKPKTEYRQFK